MFPTGFLRFPQTNTPLELDRNCLASILGDVCLEFCWKSSLSHLYHVLRKNWHLSTLGNWLSKWPRPWPVLAWQSGRVFWRYHSTKMHRDVNAAAVASLRCRGFQSHGGYPQARWMVYFTENKPIITNLKWMTNRGSPILEKKTYVVYNSRYFFGGSGSW